MFDNKNKISSIGAAPPPPSAPLPPFQLSSERAATTTQPHRIQIAGLILLSVDGTAVEWGLTTEEFQKLLETLQVPQVTLKEGGGPYVSCYSLEYALFVLGLPPAMKCQAVRNGNMTDATVADVHYQMASLLYGTLTKEAVKERVRALARCLGKDLKMAPKRGRPALYGRKKVDPA